MSSFSLKSRSMVAPYANISLLVNWDEKWKSYSLACLFSISLTLSLTDNTFYSRLSHFQSRFERFWHLWLSSKISPISSSSNALTAWAKLKFTKVGSFLNFWFLSCSRLFALPLSIFRRKETSVLNFIFFVCFLWLLAGNFKAGPAERRGEI